MVAWSFFELLSADKNSLIETAPIRNVNENHA
jgi:hypothetical protein